jgi:Protein of unknown function (DUF1573)
VRHAPRSSPLWYDLRERNARPDNCVNFCDWCLTSGMGGGVIFVRVGRIRGTERAVHMPTRSTLVRYLLGSLLLLAAGLKLSGLGVSAVPQIGWFATPWVQLLVAEWEIVLGLWLFSGATPRWSWLAALVTFASFAIVSGYLGWIGVASCGCFGTIQASPWWAFGVDVGATALLLVSRPPAAVSSESHSERLLLHWVAGGIGLCGIVFLIATGMYGSAEAALARLRGETVRVSPFVDFGVGRSGEVQERAVTLTNWGENPVRFFGGTSDCSCTTLDDLPVVVSPRSSAEVRVRLKVPAETRGQLTRQVMLRTDSPNHPIVGFQVGCRVE